MVKNFFKSEDNMAKPLQKGKNIFVFCLVIIPILNFLVFWVIVNINSFTLAFQEYIGKGQYVVGLGQFKTAFADLGLGINGELIPAFFNTMIYFWINLLLVVPLSYFVSYFLYKKIPFYKFFRVIFFMPSIISAVILVAVYKNFLLPGGPIDMLMQSMFGSAMPDLLLTHDGATGMMVGFTVWSGFGVNVVLYQGAMKRIPESVIEAGKLDGASMSVEMFKIITPLVWPTVLTTLTLAISGFMTASGPILLFTEGAQNTSTISFWIYWVVYKKSQHNYGAAVGLICTFIGLPIVFTARYFLGKVFEKVEY